MDAIQTIYPRLIAEALRTALADTPVVALLGPRQAGKSTLAKAMLPARPYFDLDAGALAATAASDPAGFVEGLPAPVTIDEVQRAPELMRAIKVAVDSDRKPGQFLLTGSANLLLMPQLSDSLAGRMEVIQLHPLTEAEIEGAGGRFLQTLLAGDLKPEIRQEAVAEQAPLVVRLLTGGFPEARSRPVARAKAWHQNYLNALLVRDVRDVAKVRDTHEVGRLLRLLAAESSTLINVSRISRELGLTRPTLDHYLTVLERLFLIRLLPAWHQSTAKRLVKTPKIHLTDSGLAATLMGLQEADWNAKRKDYGKLLESFVLQQLIAQSGWTDPSIQFSHYRDKDQVEVDCVISRGGQLWGIEVKAAKTVSAADASGLRRLSQKAGNAFRGGILFYTGSSTLNLGDKSLLAVPISKLWEL